MYNNNIVDIKTGNLLGGSNNTFGLFGMLENIDKNIEFAIIEKSNYQTLCSKGEITLWTSVNGVHKEITIVRA